MVPQVPLEEWRDEKFHSSSEQTCGGEFQKADTHFCFEISLETQD